jgi:hypothetical protein
VAQDGGVRNALLGSPLMLWQLHVRLEGACGVAPGKIGPGQRLREAFGTREGTSCSSPDGGASNLAGRSASELVPLGRNLARFRVSR